MDDDGNQSKWRFQPAFPALHFNFSRAKPDDELEVLQLAEGLAVTWPRAAQDHQRWSSTDHDQLGAKLHQLRSLAGSLQHIDEKLFSSVLSNCDRVQPIALRMAEFAPKYDSPGPGSCKGNGYRSILTVVETCASKLIIACTAVRESSRLGSRGLYICDYGSHVLGTLAGLLECAVAAEEHASGSLFLPTRGECTGEPPASAGIGERCIETVSELPRSCSRSFYECFYGRRVGFAYTDRLRDVLRIVVAAMAGYGEAFHTPGAAGAADEGAGETWRSLASGALTSAVAVTSGVRYMLDSAARGAEIGRRMENCDIQFAKGFWNLTENAPLAQYAGAAIGPRLDAFEEIKVPVTEKAITCHFSSYPVVDYIRRMLLSSGDDVGPPPPPGELSAADQRFLALAAAHCWRRSRAGVACNAAVAATAAIAAAAIDVLVYPSRWQQLGLLRPTRGEVQEEELYPLGSIQCHFMRAVPAAECEPCVILHFHGGGFVAQSPRSHETYLRQWARRLRCVIFSVDYTLSPDAHFPRAVDECYHVLCWLRGNTARLGLPATGCRIILAGDSAGGNLAVAVALRNAARVEEEHPIAAVLSAYGVFNVQLAYSPSRMLSIQDALLPLSILECCLKAYLGPLGTGESADRRNPFLSPVFAAPELLRRMPPIRLLACELDPFLDDSVELHRNLVNAGHTNAVLHVCTRVSHGVLSIAPLGASGRSAEAAELFLEWLSDTVFPKSAPSRAAAAAALACAATSFVSPPAFRSVVTVDLAAGDDHAREGRCVVLVEDHFHADHPPIAGPSGPTAVLEKERTPSS